MMRHRIALYSPGMVGLGHVRRNLLVAQALVSGDCSSSVFLVAEAREAGALPMPTGVDTVTLPALQKDADGACRARYWNKSFEETVALRARIIEAALCGFEPDALLVDHLPLGAGEELKAALDKLQSRGRTKFVLGLRDVLEAPEVVREHWRRLRFAEAIEGYYDSVWVYGDAKVFNPIEEYSMPPHVARKMRFTGYLDSTTRLRLAADSDGLLENLGPINEPFALCLVGGGSDGGPLAEAFMDAELPAALSGVLVTGPFMPAEIRRRLRRKAAARPRKKVLGFVSEPSFLVDRAERVITMGGYNNISDVLSFEKRALVVPRTRPRCEQLIRAQRLHDLGLIDVLLPEDATHDALAQWLRKDSAPARVRERIDIDGLNRLPQLMRDLMRPASAGANVSTAQAVVAGAQQSAETAFSRYPLPPGEGRREAAG
jgi:predicted glycosyltransferase